MLKLKLWRIENVILMKIFKQNPLIRSKFTPFTSTNNIKICSADFPELEYNCIHLRGIPENDEMIATYSCSTADKAKEKIIDFKIALEEFVEYCNSQKTQDKDYTISDIEQYVIGG